MTGLFVHRMPSPVGELLVVLDAAGLLHAIEWADHEARMLALLRRYHRPGGYALIDGDEPSAVLVAVRAYFDGDVHALAALPAAQMGTDFQRRVWTALRTIPPGTTISYGALAARIGAPAAIRAVGAANGANPVSVVVPCHRLIGVDGALTGYGSGVARKRWLIDHERAHAGLVAGNSDTTERVT